LTVRIKSQISTNKDKIFHKTIKYQISIVILRDLENIALKIMSLYNNSKIKHINKEKLKSKIKKTHK